MKTGDRVAYKAAFLRSIGAYTGDLPAGRGTITEIEPCGTLQLARVRWDRGLDLPTRINVKNLTLVKGGVVMEAA